MMLLIKDRDVAGSMVMALTRMVEAAFSEKIITSMHPNWSRLSESTVRYPNVTLEEKNKTLFDI